MKKTMRLQGLVVATSILLFSAPPASAEDDCKEAYAVGKDIARLDAEVNAMKKLLAELLELDRRRTALLSRALADGGSIDLSALSAVEPLDRRETKGTETKGKRERTRRTPGKVSGKVRGASGVAFVYVGDVRGRLVRGKSARIAQKNKQFSPRWLVVQRGTTVTFPNEDSIYHNVFSTNSAANFDLGIYRRGDTPRSYTFTKPSVIDVQCNMHAKMNSEVLVVPNHLYTRAKKDGSFSLARVPVGRHKIVAWAPGYGLSETWVVVPENGEVQADLTVEKRRKGKQLNKDGQPYSSYE